MKANQSIREQSGNIGYEAIAGLIAALLLVVIGLALVPTIQSSANSSVNAVGSTSASAGLIKIIPLLFVVLIIFGVIAFFVLKAFGGGSGRGKL